MNCGTIEITTGVNMRRKALFFVPAILMFIACSNTTQIAQQALNTTAKIVVAVDAAYAPQYEKARIEARETSTSWEERDAKLENWDKAADAIESSYRWLAAAQAAIDTAETCKRVQDCHFGNVMLCLISALRDIQEGLDALDLSNPQINDALDLLVKIAPKGQCKE